MHKLLTKKQTYYFVNRDNPEDVRNRAMLIINPKNEEIAMSFMIDGEDIICVKKYKDL